MVVIRAWTARTSSAASSSPAAEATSGITAGFTTMANPVPLNVPRFSDGPTSGASSQAHTTPPMAAATTGGSASAASSRWACPRRSPIVAMRASVISRVRAVSSSDSSRTSTPNPAAIAAPWVRAVCAACSHGDGGGRLADTEVLIISGNATMASTSTRANDGKAVPDGVRVARARPTNATTPRDRPAIRASWRASGG